MPHVTGVMVMIGVVWEGVFREGGLCYAQHTCTSSCDVLYNHAHTCTCSCGVRIGLGLVACG